MKPLLLRKRDSDEIKDAAYNVVVELQAGGSAESLQNLEPVHSMTCALG